MILPFPQIVHILHPQGLWALDITFFNGCQQVRTEIGFFFVINLPATFWERILFSYRCFLDNGSMILNWFTVLVSGGRNRTYFERSSCEINKLVSLFSFQPLMFLYRLLSLQQMYSDLSDFYWMYIHFMLFLSV